MDHCAMAHKTIPILRRNTSTTSSQCSDSVAGQVLDPHDRAEQGLYKGSAGLSSNDLSGPSEVPEKPLPFRCSVDDSASTLAGSVGESLYKRFSNKQLPEQSNVKKNTGWVSRILGPLCRLITHPARVQQRSNRTSHDDFKAGYDKFRLDSFDKYPDGWPRVTAFADSCDSFSNFRRFSYWHTRLLFLRMSSITELEREIAALDKRDSEGGPENDHRLKNRYYRDDPNDPKRIAEDKMEEELIKYDALLLNHEKLKNMRPTPAQDHDSLFKFFYSNKPLDTEEFDFINEPTDWISVVKHQRQIFEELVKEKLSQWPKSFLMRFCSSSNSVLSSTADEKAVYINSTKVAALSKLMLVFFTLALLLCPVILFLLTSMSRCAMALVVLIFVFIFSSGMSALAEVTVQEIFIGSSTYCAVLVTFLGNLQQARPPDA
ncbi:hypothetical protein GLAREA_08023 [Glarea lozoyensis ATCC 20868]|uniref:DUF6594 domain-containing protein n=1 Tax=Glarea lozoyensis (strain ATCC 20868 / MF5171) TaxID=1116229 RepID=S3DBY6_GLAL2|nr:uncharacterized protein GLAREA_08023 [Glarea lozoyensis ATCC 20868]EPE24173.1 hypothetical protein GLAREA_08023 [Glarea lozoyensis ATCC 20868]